MEPPFLPPSREIRETPVYSNFEELITSCFRAHWKYSVPDTSAGKQFKNWSVPCNMFIANRFRNKYVLSCVMPLHRNYISRSALQQEIRVENASFAESCGLPLPQSPSSHLSTFSLGIFASSIHIDELSHMYVHKSAADRKML